MPHPKVLPEIRFHQKYQKNEYGCWLWTGYADLDGYGRFQVATRTSIRAHRFSFELFNGPVPSGLHVLHTCDTPRCVNPAHLYVGTNADNMRDKALRGRAPIMVNPNPGEHNGRAKLSNEDVAYIRSVLIAPRGGGTVVKLAERFGVHFTTIHKIRRHKLWSAK